MARLLLSQWPLRQRLQRLLRRRFRYRGGGQRFGRPNWKLMVSQLGDRGSAFVFVCMTESRKVGTPKGRVLANGQAEQSDGKCHRKQTADDSDWVRSVREQVRVKRCGKSAPAFGETRAARQTPPGARPSVGWVPARHPVRRKTLTGRPLRWMVTRASGDAGPNPAYRLTHHHHARDLQLWDQIAANSVLVLSWSSVF